MKLHRAAGRRMSYGLPPEPAISPMDHTPASSRPPTPTTAWAAGVVVAATGPA
jgi:hypothetical protein